MNFNLFQILELTNISQSLAWTLTFLLITTNSYLLTQLTDNMLEHIIKADMFMYNIILTLTVTCFIMSDTRMYNKKVYDSYIYYIGCIIGSIISNVLLKYKLLDTVLLNDSFKLNKTLLIIYYGLILFFLIIKNILKYRKQKIVKQKLQRIFIFSLSHIVVVLFFILNNSFHVHLHTYHSLFGCFLIQWFNEWTDTTYDQNRIVHSLLLGSTTNGINFSGITELFSFVLGTNTILTVDILFYIWLIFICMLFIFVFKKSCECKKVVIIPLQTQEKIIVEKDNQNETLNNKPSTENETLHDKQSTKTDMI
tara:strand:+ start:253 stop:1179 length:927 start_codon:yes stop_codon:yes gene_type:complete